VRIRIWPDGTTQDAEEEPYSFKSDDFEERETDMCRVCEEELEISYAEPIASCKCGSREWYK